MSVPEANALSPAPVRIIALIERSALMLWQIAAICSYIANVSALRACGRLKVSRAMPSSTTYSRSSVALTGAFIARSFGWQASSLGNHVPGFRHRHHLASFKDLHGGEHPAAAMR